MLECGVPRIIQTDKDGEFTANIVEQTLDILEVQHSFCNFEFFF